MTHPVHTWLLAGALVSYDKFYINVIIYNNHEKVNVMYNTVCCVFISVRSHVQIIHKTVSAVIGGMVVCHT